MSELINDCAAPMGSMSAAMLSDRAVSRRSALRGLTHTVVESFDDAARLQPQWDALVEKTEGDIYSTYDWCAVWWSHYGNGRHLQIHLFHQGDRLVSVIPLFGERLWIGLLPLRIVRLVGCDHSVTTCAPVIDGDWFGVVLPLLIDHLEARGAWDLLHFGPLAGYYNHGNDIARALDECRNVGNVAIRNNDGPHTVFDLPAGFDTYLNNLSPKVRRAIRKRSKRFSAAHRRNVIVVPPDQVKRAFLEFIQQHQAQWRQRGQLGHFRDWPDSEAYHGDMVEAQARHGRLMMVRLEGDGEQVGCQYSYRFGRRVHWILNSRSLDPKWSAYGPGTLLFCALASAAIDAGATQVDGLRGYYDYKVRLGGMVLQLSSIGVIHRGVLSALRVRLARYGAGLLHLLYYRIWFGRLAPRFPRLQRPLWSAWIRSRI